MLRSTYSLKSAALSILYVAGSSSRSWPKVWLLQYPLAEKLTSYFVQEKACRSMASISALFFYISAKKSCTELTSPSGLAKLTASLDGLD